MTFDEFARTRLAWMLGTANAICRDSRLAEDLTQDVLIKVQSRWERISGLDVPEAYIRKMLVNEHLSWRRRSTRPYPGVAPPPADDQPDYAQTHADRLLLQAEIARLPKRQQVVLALRYYGGLSDAEIADAMGCRVGTVRGYASRALQALRIQLNVDEHRTERTRP